MKRLLRPIAALQLALALVACSQRTPSAPEGSSSAAPTMASPTAVAVEPAARPPTTLRVFAAASLADAFGEAGAAFEAGHPGSRVEFNFAGSQQLATQIDEGAPADVFASANGKQMDVVIHAGGAVSGTQATFARNRLAVIVPKDNPGAIHGLADLAKPGLKLVFAAKAVPIGQYALEVLGKASADAAFNPSFSETVVANVVSYEDDVKGVVSKISLGEADGGIVYVSDVTPEVAPTVGLVEIPDALNVIATYPIVTLTKSEHPELAAAFVEFILSGDGQAILKKHGFIAGATP